MQSAPSPQGIRDARMASPPLTGVLKSAPWSSLSLVLRVSSPDLWPTTTGSGGGRVGARPLDLAFALALLVAFVAFPPGHFSAGPLLVAGLSFFGAGSMMRSVVSRSVDGCCPSSLCSAFAPFANMPIHRPTLELACGVGILRFGAMCERQGFQPRQLQEKTRPGTRKASVFN